MTSHRLLANEKLRRYRIEQSRLAEKKVARQRENQEKVREYFKKLGDDTKSGKQYKTGVAMDEEQGKEVTAEKPSRRKVQCPHCGVMGHKLVRSKYCLLNSANARAAECTNISDNTINEVKDKEAGEEDISFLDEIPCESSGLRDLESEIDNHE